MSLPGYDAWKLATPPEYEWDDYPLCQHCGHELEMSRGIYTVWVCERCDPPELDEPDYDAWAKDGP